MDRVVDYRARLLARVAQRLQPGGELQRTASIVSLDFNPEDKRQARDCR
jgi:hypothetical protein